MLMSSKAFRQLTFCAGFLCAVVLASACAQQVETVRPASETSAESGALAIADEVMEASGGRSAWDQTRFVTWVNFGKRLQVWDRQTDDIRVENKMVVVLMNLESGEGRAWRYGVEVTDADELARTLEFAREAWYEDTLEMLLPFMLRDEGYVLEHLGEGEVEGRPVDVLRVTFEDGHPHGGKEVRLSVDTETRLVTWFDYYMDAGDARPRYSAPWSNYQKHGTILLSYDRGTKRHQDVRVFDELPASVFESPEPVPWLKSKLQNQ